MIAKVIVQVINQLPSIIFCLFVQQTINMKFLSQNLDFLDHHCK